MPLNIAITNHGYTDTLHETCGETHCVTSVLYAVGVSRSTLGALEHLLDIEGHPLDKGVTVSVERAGECDYDTWCAACGDFISHGLECECPDTDTLRDDMGQPSIDFRNDVRFKAWSNADENLLNEQDDATRGDAIRYEHT